MKLLITRNIHGRKVLLYFLLANSVFAFMLLVTIPMTMAFSDGMKLLDMMPSGYDFNYVDALFNVLGPEGRDTYMYRQLPVDMIYPFLFGIGNCLLIAYFLNKINKLDGVLFYLCLLPLMAGLADYLENFGLLSMLHSYPHLSQGSVNLTSTFSLVKSTTTTIYFIALIMVLIAFGTQRLKRSGKATTP